MFCGCMFCMLNTFTRIEDVLSLTQKNQLRILFRSQQIHHSISSFVIHRRILPVAIPVGEFLLITSIYTVIRQFENIHPFIFFITGSVMILAFVVLGVGIENAGKLTEASRQYLELSSMNPKLPHIHFTKRDRQFFKSCRPLNIRIGNSFTVVKDTFVKIMDSVVISNVINLLLAF